MVDNNQNDVILDVEGHEVITTYLRDLLNQFPLLYDDEEISFSSIDADGGICAFPVSKAAIKVEREDVTGHVSQECLYSFTVVYRSKGMSENRKANVKEWLDDLGRWLERQPISRDGNTYKLGTYPALSNDRRMTKITRDSQSFVQTVYEDATEDWAINLSAQYKNDFDR